MSGIDRRPRVELRRRTRKDGTVAITPTVRYVNTRGERKRLTGASMEEAELERARLAYRLCRGNVPEPDGETTVGEFWPVWREDAGGRLADATLLSYDRLWRRLLLLCEHSVGDESAPQARATRHRRRHLPVGHDQALRVRLDA